jgi:ribosomal protein S18 acetylase RimI-like enzyme
VSARSVDRGTLNAVLRVRRLEPADVPRADEVLRQAFHQDGSFATRLRRYLTIQPDGWLLAEDGAEPIGTVGAIDYGPFAYVGMMAVRPGRQRQGIGRRLLAELLQWLESRRVPAALLEATAEGRGLYEQLGFVETSVSLELRRPTPPSAAERDPACGGVRVEVAGSSAEIAALDRTLFGADRTRLWQWLLGEEPGPVLIARRPDGQVAGYLCVQDENLGPFAAVSAPAADALLVAAHGRLRSPKTRVMLPEQNTVGRAVLEARGWTLHNVVPHMRRGPPPEIAGWSSIYGKGSYCLG